MYARNAFEKINNAAEFECKLDAKVGLREAAGKLDIGGGQGMVKCNCTSDCSSNRCGCKKSNLLCNFRCHAANSKYCNK